jgi:hypothetical protein
MRKTLFITPFCFLFFLCSVQLIAQKDFVQQLLLDKPVTAGKLKVFPTLDNPDNYYYLPNKLRLATNDDGTPKFLFQYYVANAPSGNVEDVTSFGKSGGYVHVVIGLHVLPEELDEAKQELKKINPKGVIVGPVVYRGGTMALVTKAVITNSSNPDPNAKRVLGVGPAPVIEGDNIAVSFILDSLDAKLMYESLQTSTPDISFNLNMTLGGFQSPIGFKIEMNWDKIYQHKIFNAGLATPILKSEIGIASQELKENGGIKITQIGEDANIQRLQDVITNKLLEMCFVPFGQEGSPNWADLTKPYNDGKSYLDRATEQYAKDVDATEKRNKEIREGNMKEREYADEENRKRRAENETRRKTAQEEADRKARDAQAAKQKGDADAGQKEEDARLAQQKVEAAKDLEQKDIAAQEAQKAADDEKDTKKKSDLQKIADQKKKIADDARNVVNNLGGDDDLTNITPTKIKPTSGNADGLGDAVTDKNNYKNANKPVEDLPAVIADIKKEEPIPSIAVVASYQQKKIRHTGHYVAEAQTYFTTTLAEPFGDNIGKINCNSCIQKINVYDPLYVQREVECYLDVDLANNFNRYINFVTVSMRKKHEDGQITTPEIRINRMNFNKEGNRFKLLYGWMGDNDRRNWLNYEYKTTWNFSGGVTMESPWQSTVVPAIGLSAPVSIYTVNIDADADKAKQNDIRAVTVRVFTKINGVEQMKQTSLNLSKGVSSGSIDYLIPRNESEYEYEIEWVKGSSNVKSARMKSSQGTIYVDEVR